MVLGDRPDAADPKHDAWQRAAVAIEDYRSRHDIDPDEPTALGPEPQPGQFHQRADRTRTAAEVLDALDRPGPALRSGAELLVIRARATVREHGREGPASISARD